MQRLIIFALAVLGLAACATSSNSASPYTETAAICDNVGLESQLVSLRDMSRSSRAALGGGGYNDGGLLGSAAGGAGLAGFERSQMDVERVYQLRDRLNRFEAEVDAQFRTMTSSCKAYTRCMEMRGYNESECSASMARWRDSETSFASLSREIRQIDAEVEKLKIIADAATRKRRGKRYNVNPYDPCTCEDSVGGVFANCCSR